MAENNEGSLYNHLRTSQFLIQLDESTLPTNEALLLSYVRFIKDEKICEEEIPDVLAVHCVIHRQQLVAKNLSERLFQSLQYVIKAFVGYQKAINFLTRFYNLFDSVIEFLENKDTELRNKLITSKNDIAYMTDLYKLFNDMNLQLQGDEINLVKTKNVVAPFAAKLFLHKKNTSRRDFHSFPNLSVSWSNDDLLTYCQHLENFHIDFTERYQDILKLEIPDWVLDPFSNVNIAMPLQLEEELIKLTTNEEIKIKFKNGYQEFWLHKPIPQLYTGLCAVATLLTKKRNRLHVTKRRDLRLFLSKLKPDIKKLIK
ncbi:hypothetical protein K1T71_009272 [Dendrolimus kikuchii]|uniref:Uncharacterized protein n=1 Tax=Dendrolimus kikuchii TaxID=765133 RepID=A0ACC1CU89_9NEOP|nr:hypothetical protein K1T71_009272 [Dendrolimus kikuchii]